MSRFWVSHILRHPFLTQITQQEAFSFTMNLRTIFLFLTAFLLIFNQAQASIPPRIGWWKFDNASDLQQAETGFGIDLTLIGSHTSAPGPEAGNGAVLIGAGSYYKMQHQISANGGGSKVNEYTLQFDFKIPANGVWHTFFQTDINNSNDGDFFINTSGNIGVAAVGYGTYQIIPGEWYRLIVSVKNGSHFTYYLDGELVINGNVQAIDDRFSLENLLLIFADDDGEDSDIICSELAVWDQPLTAEQAAELGGFGHNAGPFMMTRIPYLQAQGTNTMTVCWHDISTSGTKVQYGLDSTLGLVMTGTNEVISDPYRWHTVKLNGLQPNTRYFYKVQSGGAESAIYAFKTLPDPAYTGKLRFVLLSDTHATDTTMAGKVLRAAKDKITELYGPAIENHVNGIFHSGDVVVSGDIPGQYTKQYFKPLSALSPYIPTMVVAGNHEGESPYFYQYLKLDDQSAFPQLTSLKEKVWFLKTGNSLFIGMNTNIIDPYGAAQANWLNAKLNEAENDSTIDFVFIFFHHPPFSELWVVGGTDYVVNVLFPIIKKYTKVQQMHYGHTHGFERGTITSEQTGAGFRIICGGGGGGPNDPWREGENRDFNDIHKTLNHYFFQILEIDIQNHTFRNSMYSLGNNNDPRISELMDTWYKSKNQAGPETPELENFEIAENHIQFNTSEFSGSDSLMSVHFQVIDSLQSSNIVLDSITHWTNIYNIDQYYKPVDVNKGINLLQSKISLSQLSAGKEYYFRVRYRDHNLKWSEWSALTSFSTLGTDEFQGMQRGYYLEQNIPNPFRNQTKFTYKVPEKCEVIFRIYDKNQRIISEINEGVKDKGTYTFDFNAENLASDVYIYEMNANNLSVSKKMIHVK